MGLQLLALRCSELAALPLLIGRCGLGGLRPMAAERLKSYSHLGESLTGRLGGDDYCVQLVSADTIKRLLRQTYICRRKQSYEK